MAALNSPFLFLLLVTTTLFLHTTTAANVPAFHPRLSDQFHPLPPDDPVVEEVAKWAVKEHNNISGDHLIYSSTRCAELKEYTYHLLILAHQDEKYNLYEADIFYFLFQGVPNLVLCWGEKGWVEQRLKKD